MRGGVWRYRALTAISHASMQRDPGAGLALRFHDFGARHFGGKLRAHDAGFEVTASGGDVEPLVGGDEVELYVAPGGIVSREMSRPVRLKK